MRSRGALRHSCALAYATERPQCVRVAERSHSGDHAASGGGAYGPYLGSIPDFGPPYGVRFSNVHEASSAPKAGLKAGDVLVEFDGKPIDINTTLLTLSVSTNPDDYSRWRCRFSCLAGNSVQPSSACQVPLRTHWRSRASRRGNDSSQRCLSLIPISNGRHITFPEGRQSTTPLINRRPRYANHNSACSCAACFSGADEGLKYSVLVAIYSLPVTFASSRYGASVVIKEGVGVPQPVTRSKPVTAEYLPDVPLVMSWKSLL